MACCGRDESTELKRTTAAGELFVIRGGDDSYGGLQ